MINDDKLKKLLDLSSDHFEKNWQGSNRLFNKIVRKETHKKKINSFPIWVSVMSIAIISFSLFYFAPKSSNVQLMTYQDLQQMENIIIGEDLASYTCETFDDDISDFYNL
jgi:hypothetical protein